MGFFRSKDLSSADAERPHTQALSIAGYGPAAALIAIDPDNETFIFRKFDKLGARNLLYLQSELLLLEDRLEEMDGKLLQSHNMKLRQSEGRFEAFMELLHSDNEMERRPAQERMALILELRAKIQEYRESRHSISPPPLDQETVTLTCVRGHETEEALLRQKEVASLCRPSRRVLKAFTAEFKGHELAPDGTLIGSSPMLAGRAAQYLDDEQDVVSLSPPAHADPLSRFLQNHWPAHVN